MYTHTNFKTKKALKDAVAAYLAGLQAPIPQPGTLGAVIAKPKAKPITVYQPGPFGGNEPKDGEVTIEGPHYPEPHRWYARATLKDGCIVKVK
jgi:hypothetical protein